MKFHNTGRLLLVVLLAVFIAAVALAGYLYPVGYARYTPTAATKLADTPAAGVVLPANAVSADIVVKDNAVRLKFGADPTASEGVLVPAGQTIVIRDQRYWLTQVRFIDTAAGPSEVTITYYRERQLP